MPSAEFEAAATEVKNLTKKPTDDQLLELYALFKQATVGDVTGSKPTFDIKGRYKYDAWAKIKGTSQADAEKQYIALVEALKAEQ